MLLGNDELSQGPQMACAGHCHVALAVRSNQGTNTMANDSPICIVRAASSNDTRRYGLADAVARIGLPYRLCLDREHRLPRAGGSARVKTPGGGSEMLERAGNS